jgi:3'-phosphoadenosine 5'-phosphosulfate sulfotransferase (PAPS reductase)/FAD synthetase
MKIQIPLFDSRKDHNIAFGHNIPIIINVSGGKDSSALLFWIKANYPTNPITAVYNDTGFEHLGILQYIQNITAQLEVPLVVLDSPGLLTLVRKRGQIPGFGCRYCTRSLKIDPAAKWIRHNFPSGKVINCFGFRAEESPARAKKEILTPYDDLCTLKREVLNFAPLLDWKTYDVVNMVESQGFRLFSTYEYLSRLSCRYCFLAGKRDKDATRLNDPEAFEIVRELLETIDSTDNKQNEAYRPALDDSLSLSLVSHV